MIQDTTDASMNYNKITLAFSEVDEQLFLKKYFSDSIFQFRVAFILVIILYGSFGYLDSQVIPEYATAFHAIRFLFVIPILINRISFVFHPVISENLASIVAHQCCCRWFRNQHYDNVCA